MIILFNLYSFMHFLLAVTANPTGASNEMLCQSYKRKVMAHSRMMFCPTLGTKPFASQAYNNVVLLSDLFIYSTPVYELQGLPLQLLSHVVCNFKNDNREITIQDFSEVFFSRLQSLKLQMYFHSNVTLKHIQKMMVYTLLEFKTAILAISC